MVVLNGGGFLGNDIKYIRIGELARESGVSCRTVDYYTQLGLLNEAVRSPGKHRLYSSDTVKTIKIIKELQKQHYTLEEICRLFAGKDSGQLHDKILNLGKQLDRLQNEVAALYPAINRAGKNEQMSVISRDLVTKGVQVMQILLMLLGEPNI
ncbi:MAG TPA: MerR family transcriptional regulator [Bacillota bacterium]|nr:MerR family transcriptional regulator [Bacillota bacterium]